MFRQTRAASRGFPGLAAGNDTNAVRKIVEAEIQQNDEDSAEADCRCVNGMAVLGTPPALRPAGFDVVFNGITFGALPIRVALVEPGEWPKHLPGSPVFGTTVICVSQFQ
jgi:hypothetical protein